MMKESNTVKFAVTYGRTDYFAEEGLQTVFCNSVAEVKDLAKQFIYVIPDDLVDYKADIVAWSGKDNLVITHQDDDTFLFSAVPVPTSKKAASEAMSKFASFVSMFQDDSGDEEDEDNDD